MARRRRSAGFTLIEVMITLVIMAIVLTVGAPALGDFIAAQRVRTAASDLAADMAFARAEAIKESRRAIMEPLTANWSNGWRICVDLNANNSCDAAEIRKIANPISGRTQACGIPPALNNVVFRPDGRGVRLVGATLTPLNGTDGIRFSDDMGDADSGNDRIRLVYVGISGRASVEIQDGGTACP